MTEIESRNIDFLEDEFPSIVEIKKDLELYELQQDLQPSLNEGEDLNSYQVAKMVSLLTEMRFVYIYELLWKSTLKMWKVHIHKAPHLKGIMDVFLHKLGFLHLLEKGGRIPQLDRQIIKVPRSE